jgi:hypothetical protein
MMIEQGSLEIFFSQVGLVGKNAALTAIPFGITALTYQQTSAAVKIVRQPNCCITISSYLRILGK